MTNHETLRNTIIAIVTNDTQTHSHSSEWLNLLDLRNRLAEMSDLTATREEVDAALLDLHLSGDAKLQVEEGFRFLAMNPEYVEAGVQVGGETRHLITLG